MVASLANLCLLFLRDNVERGRFPAFNVLPSHLRQSILDLILLHGKINDPNCSKALSSFEFLRDLTSLETQRVRGNRKDDDEFLKRVADTMAIKLPNDETVGANVSVLKLNLYGIKTANQLVQLTEVTGQVNVGGIIRLISQCPRLRSLNLTMMWTSPDPAITSERNLPSLNLFKGNSASESDGGLLNKTEAIQPCQSILEQLSELRIKGCANCGPFLVNGCPTIEFKNLTVLHLVKCTLDSEGWRELLKSVRGTLTSLNVSKIKLIPDETSTSVVPFPMPELKRLKLEGGLRFSYSTEFVSTLAKCEQLENVCLQVNKWTDQAEHLEGLNSIAAAVDIRIYIIVEDKRDGDDLIDECSRFKIVNLFKQKIKHAEILVMNEVVWDERFTAAMDHMIQVCDDLVAFKFIGKKTNKEADNAKPHVASLFRNKTRASKIRKVKLEADFDSGTITELCRNCSNLECLKMHRCPQLRDHHLVDLANNGSKLKKLYLNGCENVGDDGLVPIIINSGSRLQAFGVYGGNLNIKERTRFALNEHCVFATVTDVPENTKQSFPQLMFMY